MEKKEISVNHQLIYKDFGDGYKFHINTPKTKTGRPLMPSAVNNVLYNIIDAYNKAEAGKAEKEHRTPVFLPKISSHSLRHTACTNMAKHGMNIKILQYIMGHAYCDVTMDVYNHIAGVEDVKEEIIKYEKAVGV